VARSLVKPERTNHLLTTGRGGNLVSEVAAVLALARGPMVAPVEVGGLAPAHADADAPEYDPLMLTYTVMLSGG
jgi:hypothetical protein